MTNNMYSIVTLETPATLEASNICNWKMTIFLKRLFLINRFNNDVNISAIVISMWFYDYGNGYHGIVM